ncbi:MAG: hypothetical protein HOE48_19600 [Candidatus Latescibacteria bacterium]|nr:hypothetical protein [Candidatus Latescibacterota bacterium]MBT5831520.1 hypothetical protein [Candidatus Latescibacterota bacterium]
MKRWWMCLMVCLLVFSTQANADITGLAEDDESIGGVNLQPVRGGRWEITPIMSMRFSSGDLYYRAGIAVAYSINKYHQVGGSFVAGNRQYNRLASNDISGLSDAVENDIQNIRGRYLTVDEGFGSSISGFYRLNIPWQIERRTYPFVELFGARDFWGWGNVSELGGGLGVRKMVSRRSAFTTTYGYSVLFTDGQKVKRHQVTAGVSVFFR